MRLIDADVLLTNADGLEHVKYSQEYGHVVLVCDIVYAQTVDVRKWIPVAERLPEDDDYKPFSYYEDGAVLFCTENGNIGFGWYYESTKEWANEDDAVPGKVIAWMPLPEPWKGEV